MIAGTKAPVYSLVNYFLRQGMAPEELVAQFRHLNLARVHDAVSYSYYYDHQKEIDDDRGANAEDSVPSRPGMDRGHSPAPR